MTFESKKDAQYVVENDFLYTDEEVSQAIEFLVNAD